MVQKFLNQQFENEAEKMADDILEMAKKQACAELAKEHSAPRQSELAQKAAEKERLNQEKQTIEFTEGELLALQEKIANSTFLNAEDKMSLIEEMNNE